MKGQIHHSGATFDNRVRVGEIVHRVHVREITCQEQERVYDLFFTTNNWPLVKSRQTGKYFLLPFFDIVEMAKDAGIDR